MSVKEVEYVASVDQFGKPIIYKNKQAIGMLLMRLLLLEPGSDPLHPDMGVGLRSYRYSMGKRAELETRIKDQINTYLPDFQSSNVTIINTPDKIANIEITIDNNLYVYDSTTAPVALTIDDAKS